MSCDQRGTYLDHIATTILPCDIMKFRRSFGFVTIIMIIDFYFNLINAMAYSSLPAIFRINLVSELTKDGNLTDHRNIKNQYRF